MFDFFKCLLVKFSNIDYCMHKQYKILSSGGFYDCKKIGLWSLAM